jgi:hypothetical protein
MRGYVRYWHKADITTLLLAHHLVVDQFEGLGRHADFASIGVIQQNDQTDHCAGKERDSCAKHKMRPQSQLEHPNEDHVDQGPDRDRVPHEGWNAGSDVEQAQSTCLEEIIELTKRLIMEALLAFAPRFDYRQSGM